MATLLIDLDDRYLVTFREPKRDLEMPNRGVVFGVGGIATLMWNHDINFKLYYLTFLKSRYDASKVIHFLNNYRFKLYNATALEMGEPSIKDYAYLSNKYIIARTNGRDFPNYGKGPMEDRNRMMKYEPENSDQAELIEWDKYKRPIVKFMFQYIYNKVKLAYPDFPKVKLGSPDEKKIYTGEPNKWKIDTEDGYTLKYYDPNIEGKCEIAQIWDMLWAGIYEVIKIVDSDNRYFKNVMKKNNPGNDLGNALKSLGFDFDEIVTNEKFVQEIPEEIVYQLTVNPKKIESYVTK
jgi:hypothetical protein